MRRFIFDRDHGFCAKCGGRHAWGGAFDIDHDRPLHLAFDDWSFWDPENLQILCRKPCHAEKTAEERVLMPRARKARAKGRLIRRIFYPDADS